VVLHELADRVERQVLGESLVFDRRESGLDETEDDQDVSLPVANGLVQFGLLDRDTFVALFLIVFSLVTPP